MVRPGPVTLEDGSQTDLLDYALSHQDDLALKPTLLHGGNGVLLGWHQDTSPQLWAGWAAEATPGGHGPADQVQPIHLSDTH
jgi:hypothetical protein